ncbi:TPA: EAL domain-containing protein [Vibrio vulnificus]
MVDGYELNAKGQVITNSHSSERELPMLELLGAVRRKTDLTVLESEFFFRSAPTELLNKNTLNLLMCMEKMIPNEKFKRVSINVSVKQLMDDELLKAIVGRDNLAIEIVDMDQYGLPEFAKHRLTLVQESGVEIWFDDFDACLFQSEALSGFQWDAVKIDKAFLLSRQYDDLRKSSISLVDSVRDMTHADMPLIFEGVESKEIAEHLPKRNIYHQGFFYGKPFDISMGGIYDLSKEIEVLV